MSIGPVVELTLTIPVGKTSWAAQVAYCLAAREVLRREHNTQGALFRDGKLSQEDWDTYVAEVFRPKNAMISERLNQLKQEPASGDLAEVDLETTFSEKA